MKSAEEAVERLSALSPGDRAWLLGALSGSAQARLRELAARHGSTEHREIALPSSSPASAVEQALQSMTPEKVVACLDAEPAWVLAVLLAMRPWPWEEALLARLSPDRRLEVAQLRVTLPRLSQKLADTLARAFAQRMSSGGATAKVVGFEQVLRGMRLRARRGNWRLG
jgi:hypothetical protein